MLVNQEPIQAAEIQLALGAALAQRPPSSREDLRLAEQRVRADLARDHALAQVAVASGLDQDPTVRGQLAYYRTAVLAKAFREQQRHLNSVSDAEVRAEYATAADGVSGIREYHLQHILLAQERQARKIIARLGKKEDFAQLARLSSADSTSAAAGGDLGWVRQEDFDDYRFADALRKLKPGQYAAEPLPGPSGWHILRLQEAPRAPAEVLAFDKLPAGLKDKLRKRAAQRKLDRAEADIVNRAAIQVVDEAPASRTGS